MSPTDSEALGPRYHVELWDALAAARAEGDSEEERRIKGEIYAATEKLIYAYTNRHPVKGHTEDLEAECRLALLLAIDRYDPKLGAFSSYAQRYFRGARTRVRARSIGMSPRQFTRLQTVRRAIREIEKYGGQATYEEIAEATGFSVVVVERLLNRPTVLSLDATESSDDVRPIDIADPAMQSAEEAVAQVSAEDLKERVREAVDSMLDSWRIGPLDREIVENWLSESPRSQRELAEEWGVTRQSISQRQSTLRRLLAEQLGGESTPTQLGLFMAA